MSENKLPRGYYYKRGCRAFYTDPMPDFEELMAKYKQRSYTLKEFFLELIPHGVIQFATGDDMVAEPFTLWTEKGLRVMTPAFCRKYADVLNANTILHEEGYVQIEGVSLYRLIQFRVDFMQAKKALGIKQL